MYGGIERAQRPVEVERVGGKRDRQALRQHHLHDVAGTDVLARFLDRGLEPLLRETRGEIGFADGLVLRLRRGTRNTLAQLRHQFVQPRIGLVVGAHNRRVYVDHDVELALEVVEHHDLVRHREQGIGRADDIGLGHFPQPRLDIADGLVTEIADQPAGKAWQSCNFGNGVACLEAARVIERVGNRFTLDRLTVLFHRYVMAGDA